MGKVEDQIVSTLKNSDRPLTLIELADKIGKPQKTVFKSLRKLFEKGIIDCDHKNRTYSLAKE